MATEQDHFDIIVIGGGHAGAEAAWAAANVLRSRFDESVGQRGRVALITMDKSKIGTMSCNPAIGGLAKGQIVREIDALGGLMGLAADATGIQFRVLNASRGPAVHGPRCQSDKYAYEREVQRLLSTRPNLEFVEGLVEDFHVEDGRCAGVIVAAGRGVIHAAAVILTTGTFMRAIMHTGPEQDSGGRVDEGTADGISGALKRHGFELGRLKTGTPPRLARESLNLDTLEIQPGDEAPTPFSDMTIVERGLKLPSAYENIANTFPRLAQTPCWITHTTADCHDLIRANLDKAPMFNGQIEADRAGPRYCPSIEDKVVRFADRDSHHVYLEPESHESNEIYCNGISTSLPREIQDRLIHAMPGCENAVIIKYGYAVEYDTIRPHQIDATCETKVLPGLFSAGQINGTSGYEEAGAQGLLAGLNAARLVLGDEPIRLRRDQAYIGVMMDDLVTKTPIEPYRMFTSRAEHRLLLRADNADTRLTPIAQDWGLIDEARWAVYESRQAMRETIEQSMRKTVVEGTRLIEYAKRPEINPTALACLLQQTGGLPNTLNPTQQKRILTAILADLQYAGYINRQHREVERLALQEAEPIPTSIDYATVPGLRNEARQVLARFKPATFGQASRLEGVNPADLMIISVYLSRAAALPQSRM